jgi:hypothetical protein
MQVRSSFVIARMGLICLEIWRNFSALPGFSGAISVNSPTFPTRFPGPSGSLAGERIPAKTVIWMAGVAASYQQVCHNKRLSVFLTPSRNAFLNARRLY